MLADNRSKGERNSRAKITEQQADEIREKFGRGGTKKGLGREYGLSPRTIGRIVNNEIWIDAALEGKE